MYTIYRGPASKLSRLRLAHGVLGSYPFQTTRNMASRPKHNPNTYSKEIDMTPAADKTVNRLDPDTDAVQRPYEAPSGPWSQAGVQSEEYRHVESGEGKKQPYSPPKGSKGRYGARKDLAEEKGPETSGADEGPSGKSSHGRG